MHAVTGSKKPFDAQGDCMKKLIALAAIAFIAVASSFAQMRVMHALNLSFPQQSRTYEFDDLTEDYDVDYSNVQINYNMMTAQNKFSMILGVGLGSAKCEFDEIDFDGVAMDFKFGCGFIPVNNGKIVLGIHGLFGLDLNMVDADTASLDATIWDYGVFVGADVVFGVRFADKFGMMAGLDITSNIIGVGALENNGMNKSWDYSYTGGLNVIPRIGVCWMI